MINCTHPKEFVELCDSTRLVYENGDVIEVGHQELYCRKCHNIIEIKKEKKKDKKHRIA